MESLAILFVISIFIFINLPKKKDPPKDVWCEMGKAIGDALKTLGKPEDSKGGKDKGSSSPPFIPILGFAVGATLVGNMVGVESILQNSLRQTSRPGQEEPNFSRTPNNTNSPQPRAFPTEISNRLQTCIQERLIELSGVPTLRGFLESISFEREPDSEFEYQLIVLYTRVQQLRAAIESCDPTLIQEIATARQQFLSDEQIVVIQQSTTIRSSPGNDGFIILEVPFDTELDINYEVFNALSPEEREVLLQGQGWMPVLVPGSSTSGFVDASSARKIITYPIS
jgi:hypothetical protein